MPISPPTTNRMPIPTREEFAASKFLIYNCFETKSSPTASSIGGSLLLDCAMSEEEAIQKIAVYKERHEEFDKKFPSSSYSSSRHTFIVNRAEWWQEHKVKSSV
jgi:hypothetical protein